MNTCQKIHKIQIWSWIFIEFSSLLYKYLAPSYIMMFSVIGMCICVFYVRLYNWILRFYGLDIDYFSIWEFHVMKSKVFQFFIILSRVLTKIYNKRIIVSYWHLFSKYWLWNTFGNAAWMILCFWIAFNNNV